MSPGNPQSVVVDGETVVFEGPPPSDLKQLYSLIDQALTGGGRLIRAFEVDGIDAHQDISCLDRPSYTRVDVQSIAWEEACANTLQPIIKNATEAADALIAYGSAMLAIPLAQTVKEVGTVADKMGAIVSPFVGAVCFGVDVVGFEVDATAGGVCGGVDGISKRFALASRASISFLSLSSFALLSSSPCSDRLLLP